MQVIIVMVLLVASIESTLLKVTEVTERRLPAPISTEVVAIDPPGVIIKWELIQSDLEPVLGYKVRVWEARDVNVYKFETVNGKRTLVEELKKPTLIDFKARDGKVHEYVLTGPQQSQQALSHIKLNTPYLFEIRAFGASGDGYPSAQFGVELDGHDTE